MISIKVNSAETRIDENQSLSEVLTQLEIASNGIAVAINETIINKSNWESTLLNSQDDVLIIKATQGG